MEELREVARNAAGSNEDPALAALRDGAATVERTGRGILRLAGKDPVGMLNAVLTNSVPPDADPGAYALLLNPKGRVQADLRVLGSGQDILVDTEPEGAGAAREILGRYAPFSRVKLEDLSDDWSVLGLYGPKAAELLHGARPGRARDRGGRDRRRDAARGGRRRAGCRLRSLRPLRGRGPREGDPRRPRGNRHRRRRLRDGPRGGRHPPLRGRPNAGELPRRGRRPRPRRGLREGLLPGPGDRRQDALPRPPEQDAVQDLLHGPSASRRAPPSSRARKPSAR